MRALAGLLIGVLMISTVTATARAQSAEPPWIDSELIDALDASGLLMEWEATSLTRPSLDFLVVNDEQYETERAALIDLLHREQQAVALWAATAADRTLTEQELRALVSDEDEARAHVAELEASIKRTVVARDRLAAEIIATEAALREIAITRYMGGRLAAELQTIRDAEPVETEFSRATILDATDQSYSDLLSALNGELNELETEIERRTLRRDATVSALIEIGSKQLLATDTIVTLGGQVTGLESGSGDLLGQAIEKLPMLHQLRVTADVPQLGFSPGCL